ncbi:Ig-like domain repeat protein [Tunturiibacter lichenicola]|uniref:Ig-like domain repeat protein n=1 Tax=Tunturiibacter lichenicola TaxID=2051959 RepID=UPI0021B2ECF0|nr:Ig-like domain repeat protein [Edaphobacter lichenicola]
MPGLSRVLLFPLPPVVLLLAVLAPAYAQSPLPAPRSRILQAVDDSHRTILHGNTHPLARAEFDQGALADTTPLRRMVLVLQRSAEQETALQQLIDQQQDKSSSMYHQWLTPDSFGAAFGPSDRDLSAVTAWLSGHGFSNLQVNAGHTLIEFNGTAGMVRSAFRVGMHRYAIQGEEHFANDSDPQIPDALAPVVAGIASLNNFPRKASSHRVGNFRHDVATNRTTPLSEQLSGKALPGFTIDNGSVAAYGVTPYDFATIYNVLPLWNASTPIDGAGQTIAIVGQTDINPADFVNFRKLFSLPLGNTATPTGTEYLNLIYNGPNPGVTGDEGEADIDTQWSAAVAKRATIDYVVSEGTEVTQGTDLSAIYIVNNNLAPVVSYSYGECELFLGTSGNSFYKTLWQQAAAQGITVVLASGDSGSAGCDNAGVIGASAGIAVSGLGSTPYNISVGGTDFYMPQGGDAFWSATNSSATQASAKGYIPESSWNESCTNSVFGTSRIFSGETPEQVCNSATAVVDGLLSVVGGGGGPSSCIQSNGTSPASCRGGYAKPSWQTGVGVPSDGVRDTPDVSLFASSGFFGAFYVVCQQSTNPDGQPCSLGGPTYDFAGYGGTSVASPAFAGILSLVNEKTGSRQGNANYVLYRLASEQAKAGTACSAITGAPAAGCVFNDITTDTTAMPCLKGTPNCTTTHPNDLYGTLSGFNSTPGYDMATGLGSVNAANLVEDWSNASFTASATKLSLSPSTISHGSTVAATVNVISTTGAPTGDVSINALAANGSIQTGTLHDGSYTASLNNFPGGSYSVQAHYAGDGTYASSDSNPVTVTVTPEASITTLTPLLFNPVSGASTPLASGLTYPYGGVVVFGVAVAGSSGQGMATGNVTLTDSGSPLDGGVFRLNSTSNTEDQTRSLAPGKHVISANYSGDASFNASQSPSFSITIVKAQTDSVVQTASGYVSAGATVTLTAQINAQGFAASGLDGFGAAAPSGVMTFTSGSTTLGTSVITQNVFPAASTDTGVAHFTFPANQLSIGNNSITASYSGDANYQPSVSSAAGVYVAGSTLATSTTSLTLSSPSVAPGDPFTFAATVSSGSAQPTGTVTFISDGQAISSQLPLSGGTVSASSKSLAIGLGTHIITAIYSGDANYQASVSAAVPFSISTANSPSTVSVALSDASAVEGTSITVVATIAPASPTPGGTAQLILDGNLYGQPLTVTGVTITLPLLTNTLQSGVHVVQVTYSGDDAHRSTTSIAATLNVFDTAGSFTLSPSTTSTSTSQGKNSGAVTLTVNPTGGFDSPITFACTGGLPSGAVCTFTPATIASIGSEPVTTVLTISSSPSAGQIAAKHNAVSGISRGVGFMLAGMFLFFLPSRNRRWSALTILLLFSSLGVLSGCGRGGVDPNSSLLRPGNYAVTVSATGGSTIQAVIINFTVQ